MFSHRVRKKDIHLCDSEISAWLTNILQPAIARSLPRDIRQHHPQTSKSAFLRSKVMREAYLSSRQQRMDYRVNVPESCLENLWENILLGAKEYGCGFQEPFLIVVAHGIKLFTKSGSIKKPFTPYEASKNFIDHLKSCFNYDDLDKENTWVDLASEHLLVGTNTPTTLLNKSECMEEWVKRFDQHINPKILNGSLKIERYRVAGLEDAGNIAFSTMRDNIFSRKLAHAKSYSVLKESFSTALKNHDPFGNKDLLAIGLGEEVIKEFYRLSSKSAAPANFRCHLLKIWSTTKARIVSGLDIPIDYSTRKEFRISLEILEKLAKFPLVLIALTV